MNDANDIFKAVRHHVEKHGGSVPANNAARRAQGLPEDPNEPMDPMSDAGADYMLAQAPGALGDIFRAKASGDTAAQASAEARVDAIMARENAARLRDAQPRPNAPAPLSSTRYPGAARSSGWTQPTFEPFDYGTNVAPLALWPTRVRGVIEEVPLPGKYNFVVRWADGIRSTESWATVCRPAYH